MKPVFEKVPKKQWESFHCEVIHGPDYGTRWHSHPEYQLTLAVQSQGHRIVGDSIAPLMDGDLVLVGSNLPHVWHQDRAGNSGQVEAIVIRFDENFAGADLLAKPEMDPVKRLFRRAARGLHITGRTRDQVAERMTRLVDQNGLTRTIGLLEILDTLARSRDLRALASAGYEPVLKTSDQDRMERVCDYIHQHLADEIDRDRLARLAHLSPGAFSRFFRSRTGKTVPEYVNELRVGRACRMLAEGDQKVIDIALDCGYRNLANFNRRFLDVMQVTPREYRKRFGQAAAG